MAIRRAGNDCNVLLVVYAFSVTAQAPVGYQAICANNFVAMLRKCDDRQYSPQIFCKLLGFVCRRFAWLRPGTQFDAVPFMENEPATCGQASTPASLRDFYAILKFVGHPNQIHQ